jgi:alkanesulfonate monooxygenase
VIDTAEILAADVALMREQGIEVCLRLCLICRPDREQALDVIKQILSYVGDNGTAPSQPARDDSQMYREAETLSNEHWKSDLIWTGFVPYRGPVWTTLVGTPTQLADAFIEYKRIGVTQFIISGWPEVDEV